MATIQKRKKAWRVQVRRNGQTMSATFDTKAEAEGWAIITESKIIAGIAPEVILNEPTTTEEVTAADALRRYADEVSPNKRGGRWEKIRLEMLVRRFQLFDRLITSITGPDIADWRDTRLVSVSASTVNRELCLISSVFTHAMKEWRLGLTANPCSQVTKPRKPRARTQRVSVPERKKIVSQLGWDGESQPTSASHWVAFAFYLALETAMRKGEILSLSWSDIDFDARHAHLDMTKNGDERDVPLSKAATALLRIVETREPSARVVPIQAGHFDKLFREAKTAVGLSHIHFHDSRREAATTMAPKLSNVLELAAITGHKSLSMLQVYYKPKAADLAARLDA
ncbi:site-specific integrase [Sphingobium sp. CFD-1]|uniref:tyrosine-type recombinase/integrase n=1 Tax=Sphingobium sp. CFD-1 TaxID=2878545 RepID=UPI00214BD4F5|nr:site-specific integrase [Sphingobium sp. CFD-1]